jgi:N-acetylglutamate synthase-like GNAT family acetyltransferase
MQWFSERGFLEVPMSELPENRQRMINVKRGSKVLK